MPTTEMKHEDEFKLPKDVPLPAILVSVEEKSYPYKKDGEDRTFTKWVWEFLITEGDYSGLHAWGDTEPKLTNREDDKVRHWAHALTGIDYELGDGLDTDDLLELPCILLVDNVKEEKKGARGEYFYRTPIVDVLPSDMTVEPPF